MRTASFTRTDDAKLHYMKTGNGSRSLLLFHGFGQDHHVFESWGDKLSQRYTLYSFDLFYHGLSEWNNEKPVGKRPWTVVMDRFLNENAIRKFSLLGFSLGAKFVFATVEAFPGRVEEITLIAPDGISQSPWYRLATGHFLSRTLFKGMIRQPGLFRIVARLANRLGFINKLLLRFAESQMNTVERRRRVYHSWIAFRHLNFNLRSIGATINETKVATSLFVGKRDQVITPAMMQPLLRHLHQPHFEILDAGHHDLLEQSLARILASSRS